MSNFFCLKPTSEDTLVSYIRNIPKEKENSFYNFFGQKKNKDILQKYISYAVKNNQPLPHVIISGEAGYGKTTLAHIIKNSLGSNMEEVIGETSFEKIISLIRKTKGGILFIDEIHALPLETLEKMYSIMENFKYEGLPVTPFTIIGATTELGSIIKKARPFYDRFKIIIELEKYSLKELESITKNYIKTKYDFSISEKDAKIIAINSRGTPRAVIRLSDSYVRFDKNIKETLESFNILYNSFTAKDLKLLSFLKANPSGAGASGIACYLNTSEKNYLYETEPFLVQENIILRSPRGRKLTDKGFEMVKKLEKIKGSV